MPRTNTRGMDGTIPVTPNKQAARPARVVPRNTRAETTPRCSVGYIRSPCATAIPLLPRDGAVIAAYAGRDRASLGLKNRTARRSCPPRTNQRRRMARNKRSCGPTIALPGLSGTDAVPNILLVVSGLRATSSVGRPNWRVGRLASPTRDGSNRRVGRFLAAGSAWANRSVAATPSGRIGPRIASSRTAL